MPSDHLSIDEFLKDQSSSKFTATVEAIEDKPDLVKVTPWVAASRTCLCHLAINVRKSSLEGVTPTGDTHVCCGKSLKIVELHFKKGETLTAEDVFSQLSASARGSAESHHTGHGQLPSNPMPGVSYSLYSPHFSRHPQSHMRPPLDCSIQLHECNSNCLPLPDGRECQEICQIGYQACIAAHQPPPPPPQPPPPSPSHPSFCYRLAQECYLACNHYEFGMRTACQAACAERYRLCLGH